MSKVKPIMFNEEGHASINELREELEAERGSKHSLTATVLEAVTFFKKYRNVLRYKK